MYKRSFKSKFYYILFVAVVLILSTGYAYLNSSLFINGTSIINANIWSVGLDNLNVTSGSVTAIAEPTIDNKNTTTNFEVKLENQDDFYEFTVDVVNNGDHDARLNSLVEITGLTEEQKNYFEYTVNYENNESIQVNQLVTKADFVRLKIKVKYKDNIDISQVPDSAKILKLGFKLNYDLNDGNGVIVENNGRKIVTPVADGDINEVGTVVTIGDQQFYTIGTEGDNVKLLAMYNLYVGGEYNYATDVWIAYGSEATGKQDSTMLGAVSGQSVRKGTTAFSSSTQKGTNYSDYSGSIVEKYVNEYKGILEGEEYGIDVVEARLISYDELTDSETFACVEYDYCSSKYLWIYSTSYWSGSAYDANSVWLVNIHGSFTYNFYSYEFNFGVRPVIIISKSLF